MRAPLLEFYGEEYFRATWEKWVDAFIHIYEVYDGDICTKEVKLIQCPLFVLHGDKDPLVSKEHPSYILDAVSNSRYFSGMNTLQHITSFIYLLHPMFCRVFHFPNGKHNIHLRYAEQFNELVTKFLLECVPAVDR